MGDERALLRRTAEIAADFRRSLSAAAMDYDFVRVLTTKYRGPTATRARW